MLNTRPLYCHNFSTVAKVNSINRIRRGELRAIERSILSPFFSQSTILFMNRSCLKSQVIPNSSRNQYHVESMSWRCWSLKHDYIPSRRNNFYRSQGNVLNIHRWIRSVHLSTWIFNDSFVYSLAQSCLTLVSTLFQSNLSNRSCAL